MATAIHDFLHSPQVFALVVAMLIFLVTVFLVIKRWIGLPIALLLLILSLATGLLINLQAFQNYYAPKAISIEDGNQVTFEHQVLKAIDDLKVEVNNEKENLQEVMKQIQEILDTIESQKNKLQNFIEETRDRFTQIKEENQASEEGKQKTEI